MLQILKRLKLLDFLIIGLIISVIIILAAGNKDARKQKARYLEVKSLDKTYLYILSENRIFEIPGRIGKTKIQIKDGAACVLDSPCPNKTCMAKPPISHAGEWIVCLPNQVFLKIVGSRNGDDPDIFLYE